MYSLFRLIFISLVIFSSHTTFSTHIVGGELEVKANGLVCKITIRLYTDSDSEIKGGEGILNFGDGINHTTPILESTLTELPDIGIYEYTIEHTYSSYGYYTISYKEPNLMAEIKNILNSVETVFYLEAAVFLREGGEEIDLSFINRPIFTFPVGKNFKLANLPLAGGGYRYSFELTNPPSFYQNFSYPENITIGETNGLISWDTKFNSISQPGLFHFLIKVNQFDSNNHLLGYCYRAFTLELVDWESTVLITSKTPTNSNTLLLTENESTTLKVFLKDLKDAKQLTLSIISNGELADAMEIEMYDSLSNEDSVKVASITLTNQNISRDAPYFLGVRGMITKLLAPTLFVDLVFIIKTKEDPIIEPDPITGFENANYSNQSQLYPNPFNTYLKIAQDEKAQAPIHILTIDGKEFVEWSMNKDGTVNTEQLIPGIYIIQYQLHGKQMIQRGIKK